MPLSSLPRILIMMGAPGTGKGTQAAMLSDRLGMVSMSTGEVLRSEAKENSPEGSRLRQLLASGSLVPDDLVCTAVAARLRRGVPENGLILDGFPRTVAQAEYLDELLEELGLPRPAVIHLQVTKGILLKRLTSRRQCAKCGAIYNLLSKPSKKGRLCEVDKGALVQRDDDSEGIIVHRFAEYEAQNQPLVEYYAGNRYYAVNGARDAQEIGEELMELIGAAAVAA